MDKSGDLASTYLRSNPSAVTDQLCDLVTWAPHICFNFFFCKMGHNSIFPKSIVLRIKGDALWNYLENAGFIVRISKCLLLFIERQEPWILVLSFLLNNFIILGKTHASESKGKIGGYCIDWAGWSWRSRRNWVVLPTGAKKEYVWNTGAPLGHLSATPVLWLKPVGKCNSSIQAGVWYLANKRWGGRG